MYVGQTNDLSERLKRHTSGNVDATKHRLPVTCIHTEAFETRGEAMKREQYFKSLWSGRFKKRLKDVFESTLQNE